VKILVVDDEKRMATLVADTLEDEGHTVTTASNGREAIAALDADPPGLVLTDLRMPPPDGMAVLAHARGRPDPPEVVLMTAHGTVRNAVEAMREGAYDYLQKPFELDEVIAVVDRVQDLRALRAESASLREENARLLDRLGDASAAFDGIVGQSPAMAEVFALARKVAETDATVLIRGESGTGKGRIARAIHVASPRARGPFVKINCGALPETLLESELFGHEKGAFTGAVKEKPGRFELAENGTVFLDEIGEVSPATQVKLLQVLEERSFTRVGGTETLTCDVRLLAATHRDLEAMIREGEFREDLFYRLNVFPLEMPPLRVRGEDRLRLVEHHLGRRGRDPGSIRPEALDRLLAHDFPGNVRELENLLERALILAGSDPITPEHFPSLAGDRAPAGGAAGALDIPEEGLSLEALEKDLILRALDKAGGNKSHAARLLGLTRRTLYSRMEKHGLGTSGGDDPGDEA